MVTLLLLHINTYVLNENRIFGQNQNIIDINHNRSIYHLIENVFGLIQWHNLIAVN